MPLLRLCSYNLGVNQTDKRKLGRFSNLLARLANDNVDVICLQEVRPYGENKYIQHPGVENALCRSPFTFQTLGNCSVGGKQLGPPVELPSFPHETMSKYAWRRFVQVPVQLDDISALVICAHTRAGSGKHDTADSYRVQFLDTCREAVVVAIRSRQFDLVILAADLNLKRPWGARTPALLQEKMRIEGVGSLYHNSTPDHVVIYQGRQGIHLRSVQTSPVAPVGKDHDGVGDHQGILIDLLFDITANRSHVHIVDTTRALQGSWPCRVTRSWEASDVGGYLCLAEGVKLTVNYIGSLDSDDEAWVYGKADKQEGWFPKDCVDPMICTVIVPWLCDNNKGYLQLKEIAQIINVSYEGCDGEERGWLFGDDCEHTGWFPASCVQRCKLPMLTSGA